MKKTTLGVILATTLGASTLTGCYDPQRQAEGASHFIAKNCPVELYLSEGQKTAHLIKKTYYGDEIHIKLKRKEFPESTDLHYVGNDEQYTEHIEYHLIVEDQYSATLRDNMREVLSESYPDLVIPNSEISFAKYGDVYKIASHSQVRVSATQEVCFPKNTINGFEVKG